MILYLCARIDINSILTSVFILRLCIFLYCFFDLGLGRSCVGERLGYCHCYKTFDRGKRGITKVLGMISLAGRSKIENQTKPNLVPHTKNKTKATLRTLREIPILIVGSLQSLKALNGTVSLFKDVAKTRIFVLNVIE
jgi:hypothetical protein